MPSDAVKAVTTIANKNKANIAELKDNLNDQNNKVSAVSVACDNNTAKINWVEESVNNIQKSNSACSVMEQVFMVLWSLMIDNQGRII